MQLAEKERRILDMWPRFEDGEPVMIGDTVMTCLGSIAAGAIEFSRGKVRVKDAENSDWIWLPRANPIKRPVPKVVDADGVEINVGETVWHEDGTELIVIAFGDVQDGETMLYVEYVAGPTEWDEVRCLSVTHARPDSWEQLEEDAAKDPCAYFGHRDKPCDGCPAEDFEVNCSKLKARYILRRAKALAGVEK